LTALENAHTSEKDHLCLSLMGTGAAFHLTEAIFLLAGPLGTAPQRGRHMAAQGRYPRRRPRRCRRVSVSLLPLTCSHGLLWRFRGAGPGKELPEEVLFGACNQTHVQGPRSCTQLT